MNQSDMLRRGYLLDPQGPPLESIESYFYWYYYYLLILVDLTSYGVKMFL